ncbi:MAG TPA: tetratricopeptide repeat protein, partial [Planctomycetota bacterium]|nr:tetratricopeptide repeat protein [Planctomycetota bacterium]
HMEECLALARELGDRPGEARALGNLGNVYLDLEDYPKAREHYEKALALARELGDRRGEANALGGLGSVYFSLGDYPKAREMAEASLDLYTRLGVDADALFPLRTLARVGIAERVARAAAAALERATPILDRPALRRLEGAESAGVRSRFSPWGETGQDLAALRVEEAGTDRAKRAEAVRDGLRDAGRWKGRALLEGIAEHRSGGRSAEAIRIRRDQRETLARREGILERVSKAIREGKPAEDVEALREEARSLLAKAEDLGRTLAKESPRDATLDLPLGAEPEKVSGALPAGSALVEYAEGGKRLYAYVLARDGLEFLDLGERKEIDAAVRAFLLLVSDPASLDIPAAEVARAGRRLFDLLLAPALAKAGSGVERLEIVPNASLAALPFEALAIGTQGRERTESFADVEFVLDRYEVCYGPSSPVLVELASLGPRREGGKTLLLADPLYEGEKGEALDASRPAGGPLLATRERGGAPGPEAWARIPNTRSEALALAALQVGKEEEGVKARLLELSLPEHRSGSASGRLFDLYLGAEASRGRLTSGGLRPYEVLHLAAHGFVDEEFPQNSGIALAHEAEEPHGYFRIPDALELDLDANLVVLSACQTARG